MSEKYFESKEFLSTVYKIENLMSGSEFGRAFSIREFIITVGKDETSSTLEWFSLYNTQQEIRYEVYYRKVGNSSLEISKLFKWTDDENIQFEGVQISSKDGLRVLNEIKSTVEHITKLQSDSILQV